MWEMLLCLNSFTGDVAKMKFETVEHWQEWLRENHPDIIDNPVEGFVYDGEVSKQYGTNHRWAALSLLEDEE